MKKRLDCFVNKIAVLVIAMGIAIAVIDFSMLARVLSVRSETDSLAIDKSQPIQYLMINLTADMVIQGKIDVSPKSHDIYFYITNSTGGLMFNGGKINGTYSFEWSAPIDDKYYMFFDNRFNNMTSLNINWEIKFFLPDYLSALLFLGGAVIAVFGIAWIIFSSGPKPTSKKETPIQRGTRTIYRLNRIL